MLFILSIFPLAFFPYVIPTLDQEFYEEINLNELDVKLIPRLLISGKSFGSLTRSSLMQSKKV